MRRDKLENSVTAGKFDRKRAKGRQRDYLGGSHVVDVLLCRMVGLIWYDKINNAEHVGRTE